LNDPTPPAISPLSLHDALPILPERAEPARAAARESRALGDRRADFQPPRRGCGPCADARDDGRARRCFRARDDRVLTVTAVRWLLLALPVSWVLGWLAAPPLAVFVVSGLAVVPL